MFQVRIISLSVMLVRVTLYVLMKTPEQPSPSAQEVYQQNYARVCELLITIAGKIEADYNATEPKDWADVGNMGHTIEVLQDIAEFLGASA